MSFVLIRVLVLAEYYEISNSFYTIGGLSILYVYIISINVPGLFSGTVDDFKNYLKTIWFGLYDRGGSGAGSR